MAVRFVLDTDAFIDLMAGREPAGTIIPALLKLEAAGTTAITVYEPHSGAAGIHLATCFSPLPSLYIPHGEKGRLRGEPKKGNNGGSSPFQSSATCPA